MGNFLSIKTRFLGSRTPDEEEGGSPANPNLQIQYKSYGDSSERSLMILLYCSSIYKATKGVLQKLCVVFNYLRPRKAADPSLPIQNALREPLLVPTPQISSRRDSCSHSISKNTFESLTGPSGAIDDEEAQCENLGHVSRCQIYSAGRNEIDGEHVVSAPEIRCSKEIDVEIAPCVEESVGINSSRGEERDAKEQVQRSIVVLEKEKRIKHYSSRHKILLVGEGDFSFSACLALAFGSAPNIIATSLNSKAFLKKHYGNAMSNIAELRRRESKVMHEIDATKIANHKLLPQVKFDRIIFNFPYAGFFPKMPTESTLRRHRELVSNFLMEARNMISENGEIHISHKTNGFHADFNVESIASSHGLRLIEAVKFKCGDYPGYNTKYGFGGDGNFNCNPSKTFKFGLESVLL